MLARACRSLSRSSSEPLRHVGQPFKQRAQVQTYATVKIGTFAIAQIGKNRESWPAEASRGSRSSGRERQSSDRHAAAVASDGFAVRCRSRDELRGIASDYFAASCSASKRQSGFPEAVGPTMATSEDVSSTIESWSSSNKR